MLKLRQLSSVRPGARRSGLGLDRDRAFYPIVTIVIASYYALFAVMGASTHALVLESLIGAVFLALAVAGFRWSLWVVTAVLAAHGIFDLTHAALVSNPGVPRWWPEFCLTFRRYGSGVLGMVAQERAHSCCRLISGHTGYAACNGLS